MPRGPNGEWRPRDLIARSAHIMRVLTGEIEETYEPPAGERKPNAAAGGRARAARLTTEERSVSAKRASDVRWGRIS